MSSRRLWCAREQNGQPRTTPIAVVEQNGKRCLPRPMIVDWVRNLRAAGEAVLTRGRHSETVLVRELPPAEAGLFLQRLIKVPTIHLLIGVGAVGLAQNIGRRYNRLKPATTQNTASGGRAEKAQVAR